MMSLAARKPKEHPASVRLSCRVSPVTKSRAEQAARILGQTVTHFTEDAIAKRAEEVLAEQNRILLSERDFAAFVEALNSPAEPPTARLLADVEAYKARHDKNGAAVP